MKHMFCLKKQTLLTEKVYHSFITEGMFKVCPHLDNLVLFTSFHISIDVHINLHLSHFSISFYFSYIFFTSCYITSSVYIYHFFHVIFTLFHIFSHFSPYFHTFPHFFSFFHVIFTFFSHFFIRTTE